MSSQKRKIAIRYGDRVTAIRAAFRLEEYLKHRAHAKRLLAALNEDRARAEHERELATARTAG